MCTNYSQQIIAWRIHGFDEKSEGCRLRLLKCGNVEPRQYQLVRGAHGNELPSAHIFMCHRDQRRQARDINPI
jgi:hypothetical protein